ncbi:MAG TPA: hypothetical protein ENI61_07155 [Ignavibacteria bacterium]|nr:hypothetical protein [Ignavibacteria bacterium]
MKKYVAKKDAIEVQAGKGDLTVRVFPGGRLEITSKRGSSMIVEDLDFDASQVTKDFSPEGAVYSVMVCAYDKNNDRMLEPLNGDIYMVHVGREGIILDKAARERARKLPLDEPKYRR